MFTIYTKTHCPYCIRLLDLLDQTDLAFEVRDITKNPDFDDEMHELSGDRGVPQVREEHIIIYDYDTEESLVSEMQELRNKSNIAWIQENIKSTYTIIE